MQRSTTGDIAIREPWISQRSIEPLKWLGLALMLIEHVCRYVLDVFPPVVYVLGRMVFPLFAIALAVGLRDSDVVQRRNVALRLLVWGLPTAGIIYLVRDPVPLNILFTFAFGVTLHSVWRGVGRARVLVAVVMLLLGFVVEYGPAGVAAVALFCAAVREESRTELALHFAVGILAVCIANASWVPLLAPLVVAAVVTSGVEIPRVRRLFYWSYVGQWPVFAVLRGLL